MEVSSVRINLNNSDSKTKAFGQIVFDEAFVVSGVRVMESAKGEKFVAFPSREKSNGEYEDIAFPITKEMYQAVTAAVIDEYEKMLVVKEAQSKMGIPTQDQAQEAAPARRKSR